MAAHYFCAKPRGSAGNDLRLSKTFKFERRGALMTALTLANIFNVNTTLAASNLTGITYNQVSQIMDPRVLRLEFRYKF